MPFNPETALQPIVNLYHLIHILVVNSDLKVKTIDDLVALSKSKPGTLNYLTPGAPMVLYMETLRKERGADWVRVPFRGGGEAVTAIMSGTTPIGLFGEGNVVGHIRSGGMVPLAMMNNVRSPNFPNVPLLAETGYEGAPSRGWYGLFTPPGTPRPIVDRINKEVQGDRRQARLHRQAPDRAQPGAGAQLAGGVRRGDRARPRAGQAGGVRRRDDAAVAATLSPRAPVGAGRVPDALIGCADLPTARSA